MAAHGKSCLPIVERGCCCELTTCCKVQGWLGIVGSSLTIIKGIIDLTHISTVCNALKQQGTSCFTDDDIKAQMYVSVIALVVNIIVQVIFLVTAGLFLRGIALNDPGQMVHYIRFMWVQLVVATIGIIIAAVLASPVFLIILILMGVPIYCLICANSLHVRMEASKTGQSNNYANPMA